jgi:hypothetical protein
MPTTKVTSSALRMVLEEATQLNVPVFDLIQRAWIAGFDDGVQHACTTFESVLNADKAQTSKRLHGWHPSDDCTDAMVPSVGALDGDVLLNPEVFGEPGKIR